MSTIIKAKSGTQRDIFAQFAIMARKEAEQREKKTQTPGPLHKELAAKLFEQSTKKYQKNQPLIAKVEVIDPAKIFKKRIVKTIAPHYGETKLDVLGSEQLQQKERIESQRKYQELLLRSKKGKSPIVRNKSPLTVSQAAPGRTRRTPNMGGKKKRRRTIKKRKRRRTIKKRKRRRTRKKRKRRKRRSHQK